MLDDECRRQKEMPSGVRVTGIEFVKVVIYFTQVAHFSHYMLWSEFRRPRHI
jgi:hypothetical protein